MNIIVQKQKLLKYLTYTDPITSSKTTIPVLSNVLINAEERSLSVVASNLETGIKIEDEVQVSEPGSLAVNGKKFLSIIRELPDYEVNLFTDEHNRLTIKSMSSEINVNFTIAGITKSDFPDVKVTPDSGYLSIKGKEFKEMIKKVIFSISTDEGKFSLTGILLEENNGFINMVGTDGKRLSLISRRMEDLGISKSNFPIPQEGVIIPRLSLAEILKYPFEDDALGVGFSKSQIFFMYEMIKLTSNLIEGKYPDYKKIIPADRESYFIADRNSLYNAVRRVSILADESYNQIKLGISKDRLMISSKNPALGGANEEITIQCEGGEIEIAVNYLYLIDCLKEMASDYVKVDFENAEKVIMVKGEKDEGYVNLIMPMKVNI